MAQIIRYTPWGEAVSWREATNRLFENSLLAGNRTYGRRFGGNFYETAESFVLQLPLPGVNPDDVDVTIQQETLTLSWKSTVAVPENARAQWIGFSASSQRQQLTLPSAVDAEHAVADYTNGVLTLTLPKAAHAKAHTVKVTARSQEPALA